MSVVARIELPTIIGAFINGHHVARAELYRQGWVSYDFEGWRLSKTAQLFFRGRYLE